MGRGRKQKQEFKGLLQHPGGVQVTVAVLTERKDQFEERLSSQIA